MNAAIKTGRLPGLDGLRGISILLVLMLHSQWYEHLHLPPILSSLLQKVSFPIGTFGVPIFFIISGFLITYLLLKEEDKNSFISLKRFWERRCLRILPPVLIYLSFISLWSHCHNQKLPLFDFASVLLFFRNLVHGPEITGHFWSLSLEEQFYFFWPLFLIVISKSSRVLVTVAMLAGVFLVRLVSLWEIKTHELVMNFMRFDFILIGCLIALLWRNSDYKKIRTQHSNAMFALGFLSIVAAWSVSYRVAVYPSFSDMNTLSRLVQQEFITILVGGGAAMILIALVAGSSAYRPLIENRLLSGIGVISYSVYLWQQFFFFESSLPHWMMYLPVRLFFIFSVAVGSFFLIEKPFAGLRQKLHSNTA